MLEYEIDIQNADLERAMKRWEREMPGLIKLIFQRWALKVTANAQENLKRGKFGITSGANGRTGRLANSVFSRQPLSERLEIGAGAGVNYARAHEEGFSGTVTVRQHTRNVVFGRRVQPFSVGPYRRQANIRPKWYVKRTLEEFFNGREALDLASAAFREHKRKMGFD